MLLNGRCFDKLVLHNECGTWSICSKTCSFSNVPSELKRVILLSCAGQDANERC